ncbi:RcpC/CpaB family pilus assembly protein [Streptomyces jumonjinensis]|uniref:RcpC/CpaB family pilus assembly protein n=1 Tax=Streptomyces jumonjinensis TaxID=1945 RepID=UPI00331C37C3
MPQFAPVRVRGGAHRLRRAVRRQRRALAAGVALTAAALAASGAGAVGATGPGGAGESGGRAAGPRGDTSAAAVERPARPPAGLVSAPVRIADAATVRLLRPGDRVDVIAAPGSPSGPEGPPEARVVARGVRVAEVPEPAGAAEGGGALVVLSAPRAVAAELAAASAASGLAVILC